MRLHMLAASGGSHSSTAGVIVVVVVGVIAVGLTSFFRFRRRSNNSDSQGVSMTGKARGPAVQWFPKFMRPWVNKTWVKRGWSAPYDADLKKIPERDR